MKEIEAAAVLVGLFALRCIVPLALTVALGYLMNRVADRWQAEDRARVAAAATAQPKPRSVPKASQPVVSLPCWLFHNCAPDKRDNCPAYHHPTIACWAARESAEGALPDSCATCPLYYDAQAAIA
jgi:hypothetical protein